MRYYAKLSTGHAICTEGETVLCFLQFTKGYQRHSSVVVKVSVYRYQIMYIQTIQTITEMLKWKVFLLLLLFLKKMLAIFHKTEHFYLEGEVWRSPEMVKICDYGNFGPRFIESIHCSAHKFVLKFIHLKCFLYFIVCFLLVMVKTREPAKWMAYF